MLDAPVRYDEPSGRAARRKRHVLYIAFTVIVSAVVVFGVLEALIGTPGYGIDSGTAHASAEGTSLAVRYAHATRGQLASPFEVTVRRDGGFDGPVTLAISRTYLDLFLTNGVSPSAESETSTADAVLMTFDPPPRATPWASLGMSSPSRARLFTSRDGFVSVVDATGAPVVTATFTTRVHV